MKNCKNCSGDFDSKKAFDRLSEKYTNLSEIMINYMSQANLDRKERSSNAFSMALDLKRIVGGTPVLQGHYPECCVIGEELNNGLQEWFCTGVLIHPRVVLTAAHCLDVTSKFLVALNTESIFNLGNAEVIRAKKVHIHPDYHTSMGNDIAVIILKSEAKTSPVELASATEISSATETKLVGFGNDDVNATKGFGIKREVDVDFVSLRRSTADNLDQDETTYGFESDLEFVAGGNGFDSCNGDSGGPAYIAIGQHRKVAGLTSRASLVSNTYCGDGGIYTRVDTHEQFINQFI